MDGKIIYYDGSFVEVSNFRLKKLIKSNLNWKKFKVYGIPNKVMIFANPKESLIDNFWLCAEVNDVTVVLTIGEDKVILLDINLVQVKLSVMIW